MTARRSLTFSISRNERRLIGRQPGSASLCLCDLRSDEFGSTAFVFNTNIRFISNPTCAPSERLICRRLMWLILRPQRIVAAVSVGFAAAPY
jgi:hypothetical protein